MALPASCPCRSVATGHSRPAALRRLARRARWRASHCCQRSSALEWPGEYSLFTNAKIDLSDTPDGGALDHLAFRVISTETDYALRLAVGRRDRRRWPVAIVLGQGSPEGKAYLAVQQAALALRNRGIILAVSSKNDEANARLPFQKHPNMLLKEEHIAFSKQTGSTSPPISTPSQRRSISASTRWCCSTTIQRNVPRCEWPCRPWRCRRSAMILRRLGGRYFRRDISRPYRASPRTSAALRNIRRNPRE